MPAIPAHRIVRPRAAIPPGVFSFDGGALADYSGAIATGGRLDREDSLELKLRNIRVAPVARLLRTTPLTQPAGHRRAELSVTGMICAL